MKNKWGNTNLYDQVFTHDDCFIMDEAYILKCQPWQKNNNYYKNTLSLVSPPAELN